MRHLLPIEKQKSLYAMLKEAVYLGGLELGGREATP